MSKETYGRVKRDLLQCQKRPTTVSKETKTVTRVTNSRTRATNCARCTTPHRPSSILRGACPPVVRTSEFVTQALLHTQGRLSRPFEEEVCVCVLYIWLYVPYMLYVPNMSQQVCVCICICICIHIHTHIHTHTCPPVMKWSQPFEEECVCVCVCVRARIYI